MIQRRRRKERKRSGKEREGDGREGVVAEAGACDWMGWCGGDGSRLVARRMRHQRELQIWEERASES